jgi:outer membrane receptor protein involved in Fe transport
MSWKGWELYAAWNLKSGYCGAAGELTDWNTLDLTVSKEFTIRKAGTFRLSLSSRNITGSRYEIVSGYPMPGRSLLGGIEYKF